MMAFRQHRSTWQHREAPTNCSATAQIFWVIGTEAGCRAAIDLDDKSTYETKRLIYGSEYMKPVPY